MWPTLRLAKTFDLGTPVMAYDAEWADSEGRPSFSRPFGTIQVSDYSRVIFLGLTLSAFGSVTVRIPWSTRAEIREVSIDGSSS